MQKASDITEKVRQAQKSVRLMQKENLLKIPRKLQKSINLKERIMFMTNFVVIFVFLVKQKRR